MSRKYQTDQIILSVLKVTMAANVGSDYHHIIGTIIGTQGLWPSEKKRSLHNRLYKIKSLIYVWFVGLFFREQMRSFIINWFDGQEDGGSCHESQQH